MNQQRYERRLAALEIANEQFNRRAGSDAVDSMNAFYERAFRLIGSPAAREAFDMNKEPDKMKNRYGRNQAGQRMLLARRLVEAGARFVTLSYGGWDHHQRITVQMKRLMPAFDQGFAALLGDLDERGLLDETLVMVSSEFGRSPKINGDAGRDHWSKVFSVVLAGGGIRRGAVVGASGATANEPEETPITAPKIWPRRSTTSSAFAAQKELMAPGDPAHRNCQRRPRPKGIVGLMGCWLGGVLQTGIS